MQITVPFVIGIIVAGSVLLGVACTISWRILGRHLGRTKAVDPEDQLTALPNPRHSASLRRQRVESLKKAKKLEMDHARRNGNYTPSVPPQSRFVSPSLIPYPSLKSPAGLGHSDDEFAPSIYPSELTPNHFNILQPASIYSSSIDKAPKDQSEVTNEVTPGTYNKPQMLRRSRHSAYRAMSNVDRTNLPVSLRLPAYSPGGNYPQPNSSEPSSPSSPHFRGTAKSTIKF